MAFDPTTATEFNPDTATPVEEPVAAFDPTSASPEEFNPETIQFDPSSAQEEDKPYTLGDFGAEFVEVGDFVAGLPAFIYKMAQTPINAAVAGAMGEKDNFIVGREMTKQSFEDLDADMFGKHYEFGEFLERPVSQALGVDTSNTAIAAGLKWVGKKLEGQMEKLPGGENSPKAEILNVAMALVGTRAPKAAFNKIKQVVERKPATSIEKAIETYKPKTDELPPEIKTPDLEDVVTSKQAMELTAKPTEPLPELPQKYKEMPLDRLSTKLPEDEWVAEYLRRTQGATEDLAQHIYKEMQPAKRTISDMEALKGFENYAGTYFGNLGNISDDILQKAVDFEQAIIHAPHTALVKFEKGLKSLRGMDKPSIKLVERDLLNNNIEGALDNLTNAGKGAEGKAVMDEVRSTLDSLGKEAYRLKLITKQRKNYLPRLVKDYEGMAEAMGKEVGDTMLQTIDKARQKAFTEGKRFDAFDEAAIANKFLQTYTNKGGAKSGYRKERKFDEVPPELEKFYAPFSESYNSYVRRSISDIETAKFFGKNLKKDPQGKIDMENSIGTYVFDQIKAGKISDRQAKIVTDNLRARFVGGNRSNNKWLSTYKNMAIASLLNDVSNTARQLGEIPNTMLISQPQVMNGIKGTLAAAVKGLVGKNKLRAEDFGIIDSLTMLEVSGAGISAHAAKWALKLNFFTPLDKSLKTLNLNASLEGAKRQLKTPEGRREFAKDWKGRFGDNYNTLVDDLRNGRITDQTNRYAFSNLVKFQAATKGNWTPKMLESQTVRGLTTLKSFAINQMNMYRTEAYKKIKRGDTREGVAMLAKIGLAMHLNQASGNMVADWLLGREQKDQDFGLVASHVAKSFLFHDFAIQSFQKGDVSKGTVQLIGPPLNMFDKPLQDSIQDLFGEGDSKKRYIDLLPNGKSIRGQFFGGGEDHNNSRDSREED